MSELVSTHIRNTVGKLALPHLSETIREHTRRAGEGKMGYLDALSPWCCPKNWPSRLRRQLRRT
ncbi:hypothetical protein OG412_19285 [Streptomyces antibioticus]|nr:hypothetical protein [Streptomyces antibioticus]